MLLALDPATPLALPVPQGSILSQLWLESASPLVQTMLPITISMAQSVSSAMENALPALVLWTTTAIPASTRRSSTRLPKTRSTAPRLVALGSMRMAPTAEVSLIESELVCAANCETCTSGAVADCSYCSSGFYLNPSTNACEASCPNGYYEDASTRTCPQCDDACLLCTGAGSSSCSSCSPQYYDAGGNTCLGCDPLCDGCTDAGNTFCSACAATKYPVHNTNTCVTACSDHAANFYLDVSTSTCK